MILCNFEGYCNNRTQLLTCAFFFEKIGLGKTSHYVRRKPQLAYMKRPMWRRTEVPTTNRQSWVNNPSDDFRFNLQVLHLSLRYQEHREAVLTASCPNVWFMNVISGCFMSLNVGVTWYASLVTQTATKFKSCICNLFNRWPDPPCQYCARIDCFNPWP